LPNVPDPHAIAVIGLTVVAFYFFSRGNVPLQTTSLFVLAALTLGFYVFPYEHNGARVMPTDFFLGFGHEALITISALMILGRGLVVTGALEPVARWFSRIWTRWPQLSMLLLLIFCAAGSGVMNDTPIVVLMMPILVSVSLRTQSTPAKSLLPMNYAVLIGGMSTTIGTSTNLLVVSIAADLGMRRFGLFDFFHVAALAAVGGLLYVWLIVPRLLPAREAPMKDAAPRLFSAVLHVGPESYANGRSVSEVVKKADGRMRIKRIERGKNLGLATLPSLELREGDRIFVVDTPENLKEFETLLGLTLYPSEDADKPVGEENPLTAPGQQLAEVVVTDVSMLNGNTLRNTRFGDFYNVIVLALHRSDRRAVPTGDIGDTALRVGDVLLVQGAKEDIQALRTRSGLLVLDQTTDLPHSSKAPLALLILAGVVIGAATKVLPISISALVGVLAMVLTGCLGWKDIGAALSSRVILLVVASLALGSALTRTGGTDFVAQSFLVLSRGLAPAIVLGLLMLLMALFTNFVSNNAAAAIGTPVAVSIAQQLGAAPEPFVLAILFGANFCYATPMAYQTNIMVMSAGSYRFSDFVRAGLPLTALMLVSYALLLPRFFPL
jgi:di/tricarboxylate transporter